MRETFRQVSILENTWLVLSKIAKVIKKKKSENVIAKKSLRRYD